MSRLAGTTHTNERLSIEKFSHFFNPVKSRVSESAFLKSGKIVLIFWGSYC